jgi:Domain of unknown function (DUF6362)
MADDWTPSMVEARLSEAAYVLKRLPEPKLSGYFSTWPEFVYSFADKVGQEPKPMRVLPSSQAISRMEETLTWTVGLDPIDGKIVWMKAYGARWKSICWAVGLQRSAAHQHWLFGLSVISLRLNKRRFNSKLSKQHVIKLAGGA